MKLKSILLVTSLLLMTFSLGSAQTWDQAKGIGLAGGFIKFFGGDVDRAALGALGGICLRYGASPHVMIELNTNYGSIQPSKPGSWYKKESDLTYRTFLYPINLEVRYTPIEDGGLKPYGLIGGGILLWDLRYIRGSDYSFWADQKWRWGRREYDKIQRDALLTGGVGVETFLSENLALDVKATVSKIMNQSPADNVGVGDENGYFASAMATLTFYFGNVKDTDGDGILDKHDADPIRPEDFDGFEDEDGAPDFDNDNDGIRDLKDKEPNVAEDKDGFQDEDGAPDPDNDEDGILDVDDRCPNEAEDFDGFEDDDGCPELDNDGDGIKDGEDQCPNAAETVNGYQDEDGCPDEKPVPKLKVEKGAKLILRGVNFKSGSAELTPDSYATLDSVVAGLKGNPTAEIEIRGYTDSRGRTSTNQELSQRRAMSVLKFLVDAGVERKRLSAVGYGENDPIASNATADGRAKNRRIEFFRTR